MKQFLLYCFAFSFLVSCKKSPTQTFQSYFRMTIDGTRAVTANMEIKANNPRNTTSLIIYGRWSTGELSITLSPYDNTLGEKIVNANFGNSPRFSLFDLGQTQYYAGDNGLSGGVTGSGKINILEISNEYVKGTFEFGLNRKSF